MKIAIPVANDCLCMHFGHCQKFSFFEVDKDKLQIVSRVDLEPPAHEPGVLPKWISEQGADIVLAGGMGSRAQSLFGQNGITVHVGVVEENPEKAVMDYLTGQLQTGTNACDH
jgi:ATP-binding protein involved in chromosome partitioning